MYSIGPGWPRLGISVIICDSQQWISTNYSYVLVSCNYDVIVLLYCCRVWRQQLYIAYNHFKTRCTQLLNHNLRKKILPKLLRFVCTSPVHRGGGGGVRYILYAQCVQTRIPFDLIFALIFCMLLHDVFVDWPMLLSVKLTLMNN